MNETKHPLRLEQHGCAIYTADCWQDGINHGGSLFASTDFGDDDDQHYALCRAQRIVQACNTIDQITAQRDALLAACKAIVAAGTQPVQFSGLQQPGTCEILRGDCLFIVNTAKAAIALCERGDK